MIDGDSGSSCFSPRHKGCYKCEEEEPEPIDWRDYWDDWNETLYKKIQDAKNNEKNKLAN